MKPAYMILACSPEKILHFRLVLLKPYTRYQNFGLPGRQMIDTKKICWGLFSKLALTLYKPNFVWYLIVKSPSLCSSFFLSVFLSFLSNFSELWLAKTPVSGRGSGIPIRGCVFLYSFSFLPQHSKGKSAQKIGMSISTAVVNMIFSKWCNITA